MKSGLFRVASADPSEKDANNPFVIIKKMELT